MRWGGEEFRLTLEARERAHFDASLERGSALTGQRHSPGDTVSWASCHLNRRAYVWARPDGPAGWTVTLAAPLGGSLRGSRRDGLPCEASVWLEGVLEAAGVAPAQARADPDGVWVLGLDRRGAERLATQLAAAGAARWGWERERTLPDVGGAALGLGEQGSGFVAHGAVAPPVTRRSGVPGR